MTEQQSWKLNKYQQAIRQGRYRIESKLGRFLMRLGIIESVGWQSSTHPDDQIKGYANWGKFNIKSPNK